VLIYNNHTNILKALDQRGGCARQTFSSLIGKNLSFTVRALKFLLSEGMADMDEESKFYLTKRGQEIIKLTERK